MKRIKLKKIFTTLMVTCWVLLLLTFDVSSAQGGTPLEAAYYTEMAEKRMNEALETYGGINYPSKKLWTEAIHYGEMAVQIDPDYTEAHYQLAKIYQSTNWYYREARQWEKYVQLVQNQQALTTEIIRNYAYAHFRLGYAAYQKDEIDFAVDYLQEAARIHPEMIETHYWLGRVYYEKGNLENAYDACKQVVSIDSNYKEGAYFLDKTEEAIKYGKQAYEYYEAGYNFYKQGSYQQALSEYQQAISYNSRFTDAYYWLGRIYYELGNYRQAADYWWQVLHMDPGNDKAAYWQKQAEKYL